MRGKRRAIAEGCVLKATRLRVYPNAQQRKTLPALFGHARFVWNWALARQREHLERGEPLESTYALQKELTALKQDKEWLSDIPVSALQTKLHDLDRALTNFFERRAGFAKFKSKYKPQSVRVTLDKRHQMKCFAWTCGVPMLPKLGALKVKGRALPEAMPDSVTLSRDGLGQVWLSFSCEERIERLPLPAVASAGGDLGIKTMLTLSDAVEIENPRFWERARPCEEAPETVGPTGQGLRPTARNQAPTGEAAWPHCQPPAGLPPQGEPLARRALRRHLPREPLHQRHECKRTGNDGQTREERKRKGRAEPRHPRRGARRACAARALQGALVWKGMREVDRWFPSPKLCSACGAKAQGLKLHHRHWTYAGCETRHHRDRNAAVNIEAEGLRVWYVPEAPGRGGGAITAPAPCAPPAGTPSVGEGHPAAAASRVSANPNGGLHSCLEHA